MTRIAILASGNGTDCEAVMTAVEQGQIPDATVAVVIADRPAPGLDRARRHGVTALLIDRRACRRAAYDTALAAALAEHRVDLVVLAGYLSMVDGATVTTYRNRIINVHPSLIPAFCGHGFYGERVHQAVLDAGAKLTGVTVHFVDEGTDSGPIILQEAVDVLDTDDVATLAARVLVVEHRLLPEAVALYCSGRLSVQGRQVHIMGEGKK
ncbi:MAG: phosphoribosylglycinamide formyltransferase [Coprothermobacter sp.]|nr:phosphoribosylglycinamide formyltransferase [Coprothermobacter sp.]